MADSKKVHSKRTSIIDYLDYRDYIVDRWNELKESSNLSFESAARKLDTSKSYMKMVMSKKRHITQDKIPGVAKILKLDKNEHEYFFMLFLYNTTNERALKAYLRNVLEHHQMSWQMGGLTPSKGPELSVFNEWPRLVLHSLSRLVDFSWDKKWLGKRVINSEDMSGLKDSVMKDLIKDGVIEHQDGKYKGKDFILKTMKGTEKDFLNRMMTMFLNQALKYTTSETPHPPGPSGAILLPLSKENFKKATKIIADSQRALWTLSSEDPQPEELYFYVTYMAGLTRSEDDKKSE